MENVFNQQGQHVNNQYNAAGNINVNNTGNVEGLNEKLDELIVMIQNALNNGTIDQTTADAVNIEIANASSPERTTIVEHLTRATEILKGVTAAEALVKTFKALITSLGNWML
jgi:hypothetical protein